MNTSLARTPLFDWHATHQGRMVDFAGWSMPVQYGSIVEEHKAVRRAAGLFDVSHMGRFRLDGPGAGPLLDRLCTRRVMGLGPGKIRYSLVTNEQGGILDDVLVYHVPQIGGGSYYLLVVNASNRQKLIDWLLTNGGGADDVGFRDETLATAMIAVQGPRALDLVQPLLAADVRSLGYYTGVETTVDNVEAVVSRTGYTGEDGCELIVPASLAMEVWSNLIGAGAAAAGLGARDTLRLEAGMPLYGHELSESIDPYQADLVFAVNLADRQFVGREALARVAQQGVAVRRIGLALTGKRVPREKYAVYAGETQVGEVTSGTFSPTLERPIAMAYVQIEHAAVGTSLAVDIRGQREPATVVKLPFYVRAS